MATQLSGTGISLLAEKPAPDLDSGMDLLQVALIVPNENHGIFRGYKNFRSRPSIDAHIEALP